MTLTEFIKESLNITEAINNRQMEQAISALGAILERGGVGIGKQPILYAFGDKNFSFVVYNKHRQGGLINWSQRKNSQITSVVLTNNIDAFLSSTSTYVWDAYVDTTEMNTVEVAKFVVAALDGAHNFTSNDLKSLLRDQSVLENVTDGTAVVTEAILNTKVKGSFDLSEINKIEDKINPYTTANIVAFASEIEAFVGNVGGAIELAEKALLTPTILALYMGQQMLDTGLGKREVTTFLRDYQK
nr:MAG TPA: hypothetical protein [Bacteriophage sp.]